MSGDSHDFQSCDQYGLNNLTSGPYPDVVTQIWWHSDWWVWRKRFWKELMRFSQKMTKSAILTQFRSCDWHNFCNLTSIPWPNVETQIL